jgi:hypothetical protein
MCNFDLSEASKFLQFVAGNGAPRELRVLLPGGKVMSGVFGDMPRMAAAAGAIDRDYNPTGLYYGLHHIGPRHVPHVAAGAINKIQRQPKHAVKAMHIDYAGLLLVDVDPPRPSGVCSTEAEKAAAWEVAESVRAYLSGRG